MLGKDRDGPFETVAHSAGNKLHSNIVGKVFLKTCLVSGRKILKISPLSDRQKISSVNKFPQT